MICLGGGGGAGGVSAWSPLEASHCITKFARSRWEKLSPMIDDITCIVVKLGR